MHQDHHMSMCGQDKRSGLTLACMQELAVLLRKLKSGGHKALIFTQMARMLDILEVMPARPDVLPFSVDLATGSRAR